MKKVDIVFCSDANFFPYLSVSLKSIINCASQKVQYVIHVVHNGMSWRDEGLLRSELKLARNFRLNLVDIRKYEYLLDGVYTSGHLTSASYWRILLPLLLTGVDKVLYLDVDTLVLEDVSLLFEEIEADEGKCEIAGCIDYGIGYAADDRWYTNEKRKILEEYEYDDFENYINSGVLFLNLDFFRKNKTADKLLELILKNNFQYHDQDAINVFFKDKIKILDNKWNFNINSGLCNYSDSALLDIERRISNMDIAIIHYVDSCKPWLVEERILREIWVQVALQTPFFASHYFGTALEMEELLRKSKRARRRSFMRKLEKTLIPDCLHKLKRNIKIFFTD